MSISTTSSEELDTLAVEAGVGLNSPQSKLLVLIDDAVLSPQSQPQMLLLLLLSIGVDAELLILVEYERLEESEKLVEYEELVETEELAEYVAEYEELSEITE